MNNKTAIFLDIDGTLYDSTIKGLRPKTVEILDKLSKDDNYDLFIATGRTINTIVCLDPYKKYFKGFVLANGQNIIIDDKVMYCNGIDYHEVNRFVKYATEHNYCVMMLTLDKLYINIMDEATIDNFRKYVNLHIDFIQKQVFDANDFVNQMWIFVSNEVIDELRPLFPKLEIIKWGHFGADIIPQNASKGDGVEMVIKQLGYKLENTYAIGDSDNDTVMFEKVGTSICMGNGTPAAKLSAKIIGEDITNDGLDKSIRKYIMKEKEQR